MLCGDGTIDHKRMDSWIIGSFHIACFERLSNEEYSWVNFVVIDITNMPNQP